MPKVIVKFSELEIALLKFYFQKNRYPTEKQKEIILEKLQKELNSQINVIQLSGWFQVYYTYLPYKNN